MKRVIITRPPKSKKIKLDFQFDKKIMAAIKKADGSAHFNAPDKSWYASAFSLKALVDEFKSQSIYFKLTKKMADYLGVNDVGQTPQEVAELEAWLDNHPSNAKELKGFDQAPFKFREGFSLYGYQQAGVAYGIERNGRLLIADEMGLGKTVQAIALLRYYQKDLPAIIVAPASLLYNWKKEILTWLPDYNEDDVNIIQGMGSKPKGKVSIVSYNFIATNYKIINQYIGVRGIVIVDECHNIKNLEAQRTEGLLVVAHAAKRAIFMSGTPILNRIAELFPQIHAVSPELFPSYDEFVYRYCNAQMTKFGLDVSGASHVDELLRKLRDNIMVRRMKKDVLKQLPEKKRSSIAVDVSNDDNSKIADELVGELTKVIEEILYQTNFDLNLTRTEVLKYDFSQGADDDKKSAKKMAFEAYRLSGLSKIPFILEWIDNKLTNEIDKLIIFGHHEEFLSAVQEKLESMNLKFIRIDGTTKKEKRFDLTEQFQNDESIQVALLSINAASVGLTLTAASNVLTGELPYTPGIALQSEDRVHRNGQKNGCNIYYPVANNSVDPAMWQNLNTKNEVSNLALDGGMGTTMAENFDITADGVLESLILSVYNRLKQPVAA
jgi:SWI/SNF-related matrix-associated actin-dependent regulator 1 of chromatin subfamily A